MEFESREDALHFLLDVADQVKRGLDSLQDETVKAVRDTAHAAWEKRIRELASFLEAQGLQDFNEVSQNLCAEVAFKLEQKSHQDIADSLAQLVDAKVQGKQQPSRIWQPSRIRQLLKDFQNPFRARQLASGQLASEEALKHYRQGGKVKALNPTDRRLAEVLTEVTPLEYQQNQDTGMESKPPPTALSMQDAELLHTEGVNYLGYLIRAPVLATAAQCPVTSSVWPFLQAPKGKAEKPFTVSLGSVLDKYHEYVLTGWHTIVSSDSRTSLEGAISLGSCIARNTVEDAISSRLEMLAELERTKGPPMVPNDEGRLILMQADITAAYAASDALFKELALQHAGIKE